jgi:tetratricopeptide (TPR) repeat protein
MHCHTSSGRFRQKDDPNTSCAPCHEEKVADPTRHTYHLPGSAGSLCISCHMPKTTFARMERHDHSMRPPAPAATAAFGSPNACNLCHTDRDAAWADAFVRQWRSRDYQKPLLYRAGLIEAARKREWGRLPEMLDWLEREGRDPVFAASLIRLLRHCDDEAKKPVLIRALGDASPLVRASAAEALGDQLDAAALQPLVKTTGDDYLLVRVRAASSLAGVPPRLLDREALSSVNRALGEFAAALRSRPDDGASHYNLGNLHFGRGAPERAIDAFETAIRLRPELIEPHVNLALAYSAAGRPADAERSLRRALQLDPAGAAANFNLGLLLGELGRIDEAKEALRLALVSEPDMAPAAYNLAVMSATDDIGEAIRYCRLAAGLRPQEPRYAYTLAFYLRQGGDTKGAAAELRDLIVRHPEFSDAHGLLAAIERETGP